MGFRKRRNGSDGRRKRGRSHDSRKNRAKRDSNEPSNQRALKSNFGGGDEKANGGNVLHTKTFMLPTFMPISHFLILLMEDKKCTQTR